MGLSANLVQWIREVAHFCPGVPVLLVGCKKDLRSSPRVIEELKKSNQRPVTPEEVCYHSALNGRQF
jgi:GTPase SAR1 family protein